MTELNIGFGGVTDSTYKALSGLVKEHAASDVQNTIFTQSAALRSGAIEQVAADKSEITVHAMVPGSSSTTWIRDWGLLPKGVAPQPNKGRAGPSQLINVLRIGREAAGVQLSDAETLSEYNHAMELHGADMAQTLCRGIFGGSVVPQATATWSGTAANSTVDIPFLDVSMFVPGKAYDFVDTSAATSTVVRCTNVVPGALGSNTANVAGTVSFINDVPAAATGTVVALSSTAVAVDDVFLQRGTTAGNSAGTLGAATAIVGNAITSFDDIAGSGASSALYGLDPATLPGWRGNNRTLSGPVTQEGILGFAFRLGSMSGTHATHAFMGPQALAAYLVNTGINGVAFNAIATAAPQNSVTRVLDSSMDKYGQPADNGVTPYKIAGAQIVMDQNVPATRIIFHNKKTTKLYYWRKIAPELEAGGGMFVDRDTDTYSAHLRGSYQLITTNRQSVGVVTNLQNL